MACGVRADCGDFIDLGAGCADAGALGKIVFTLDERCNADTLVRGQFYTSGLNPSMPPNHAADG